MENACIPESTVVVILVIGGGEARIPLAYGLAKATDGKVEFEAHFVKPGTYEAWGPFQRAATVHIVLFVVEQSDTTSTGSPLRSTSGNRRGDKDGGDAGQDA